MARRLLRVARMKESCLLVLALALLAGSALGAVSAHGEAVSWRRSSRAEAGALSAVAFDPESGRLAVGDADGVSIGAAGGPLRRIVRRGPVRDLAFLEGGALLVATQRGCFAWSDGGHLEDRSPRAGETARSIQRIARVPGLVAIATGAGAYVSPDAVRWQRVRAIPSGRVDSVALRTGSPGHELWMVVAGEVWRATVERAGAAAAESAPLVIGQTAREDGVLGVLRGAVDVALSLPGIDVAILAPDAIAVRAVRARGFRRVRASLPPAARITRIAAHAQRLWLATDAGLLEAPGLEGPWRRAAPPAGSAPTRALARGADGLYAATASGLLEGHSGRGAPPAVGFERDLRFEEPDIARAHRAALGYLGLGVDRLRRLRDGVDRRGLLPTATLRLAHDWARTRERDFDEAFLSGAMRQLHDSERKNSWDYEVSLALTWELGDVLYHPEAIDVSREAREVLEVRDDVLDEITQLYFERRRVLMELAALDPAGLADAARLRLRADELAAGLDAWTGGWFGREAPPLFSRHDGGPDHPAD